MDDADDWFDSKLMDIYTLYISSTSISFARLLSGALASASAA